MAKTDREQTQKRNKTTFWGVFRVIVLILMMLVGIAFLVMIPLVDALPGDVLGIVLGTLIILLLLSGFLMFRKNAVWRGLGFVLSICFMLIFGMGIYYLFNTYEMFQSITVSGNADQSLLSEVDVSEEPFNIYITGIDQWNKDRGYDLDRSDVNMIVTVNPKTRKILLTSIPRDAYIVLHRTGTMDKLTHTGIYGVDETLTSVEEWLGIDLNYYVKANFNACVDLVEAIDGIDIYNPVEFTSALTHHLYPKGNIHLKGYGALYYARERKAFEGEDQKRVKNQLIVVKAILKKMLSSSTLLTRYGEIMDVLGDEIETNMPASDIQILIKKQLANASEWDIESQSMEGEYDMEIVASMDPSNEYSVLKVYPSSLRSCLDEIDKVMNPKLSEIEKAQKDSNRSLVVNIIKKTKTDLINRLKGKKSTKEEQ